MFIVPALSPRHVLNNNMKLSGTVELALAKAIKLAKGDISPIKWVDEDKVIILKPSLKQVKDTLLSMRRRKVAFDVETNGRHPLECELRCIAFYDGRRAITVPLLHRVKKKDVVLGGMHVVWESYWGKKELPQVIEAIRELLQNCTLYTQNGQFDRMVVEASLGIKVPSGRPHFDTLLGHHVIAPYLPHNLGFLSAMYTGVKYYKATETGDAWSGDSDHELWLYNSRDCITTWLIAEKMEQEIQVLPQHPALYEQDAWQEAQCERWKRVGIKLDRYALAFFRQHYQGIAKKALAKMKEVVLKRVKNTTEGDEQLTTLLEKLTVQAVKKTRKKGVEEDEDLDEVIDSIERMDDEGTGRTVELFNPASLNQLRVLMKALGIQLEQKTATGQLSTAKEILTGLRKELLNQKVSPDDDRIAFLDFLFAWRESSKVDSTYLRPEVLRDGRVHPTFSVHVVPTGRLSSQKPNFQNQPSGIRGMFVADEDHVLVSGDWDALELRLGAYQSQDPNFLKVFREYDAKTGPKPHHANMAVIFGLPPTKEAAEANPGMYVAAKTFAYAVAYGAGEQKMFENSREEMPDLDFKAFKVALTNYRKFYARLFAFQREVVQQGTQKGFLDSSILKRRVYFFEKVFGENSPEATMMQNFPYQSGGADVVGLANRRIIEKVLEPWRKKLLKKGQKWTDKDGVIHVCFIDEKLEQVAQVHDELLFIVPKRLKDEFIAAFKLHGEEEVRAGWKLPLDIKGKARWKPVQARCTVVHEGKPCREATDLEMTHEHHWEGKCSKGHAVIVDVDPKLMVG